MDMDALRAELKELAGRETWTDSDEFSPYDFSGGKFDDAYWGGHEDGKTELAASILERYFGERG